MVTHTIVVVVIVVVAEDEPDRLICAGCYLESIVGLSLGNQLDQSYRLNEILEYEADNASNLAGCMITFLYKCLYT